MRFWFDTEFIDDGRTIDLLSIGIVAEDGRELYLEIAETDWSKASPWVRDNVIVYLGKGPTVGREEARSHVLEFIGTDDPEIWAYYASYDWVALCQLFGTLMDLPAGWPRFCRDLKQLAKDLPLPAQTTTLHHALEDARWTRESWWYTWRILRCSAGCANKELKRP